MLQSATQHPSFIDLIRRLSIQALMPAFTIVEPEIVSNTQPGLCNRIVRLEVRLLVFQAAPQAFYEHIVYSTTFAVHADLDASLLEDACEGIAGKLAALISVLKISGAP